MRIMDMISWGSKKKEEDKKTQRKAPFNPAYSKQNDDNDIQKDYYEGNNFDEIYNSQLDKKQHAIVKNNENNNIIVLNKPNNSEKCTIDDVKELFNKGVKNDIEKKYNEAISCWRKIGIVYENNKNQSLYVMEYVGRSLYNLALYYDDGKGVVQDLKKAHDYYKKAVDLGNVKAYCNLGYIYMKYPNKESEGIRYFQIAAEKGDIIALYNLGCYYYGKKDKEKSIEYFKKAAMGGNEDAKAILQKLSD